MQSGDLDAFEEFFNTYKRPVYTTALAITRDPFLAEEILQDCFVKAYRVRHRLRTRRLAAAVAAARHHQPVLQPHRAPAGDRRADHRADQQPRRRPHLSGPDQVAESREIIEVLQRGIDALPPKQQTAIILYYLHGYSLAEAAEIADCNVGTMKSRLHYALKALRSLLPAERRATAARAQDWCTDELP